MTTTESDQVNEGFKSRSAKKKEKSRLEMINDRGKCLDDLLNLDSDKEKVKPLVKKKTARLRNSEKFNTEKFGNL